MGADRRLSAAAASAAEEKIRRTVQRVLRGGLAVAVFLMAAGLGLSLAAGERTAPAVRLFALGHHPAAQTVMAAGVVVLALTPLLRVLALIALWAIQSDWRFVAVGAAVLVVLVTSAAVGHG